MNRARIEFTELSQKILDRGVFLRFQAKGYSMFPAIKDGDILKVKPFKIKEIKLGEVIFYRTAGKRMVAHRVIKKIFQNDKLVLRTKGDFNINYEYVTLEDVLGLVIAIERNGRQINLNKFHSRLMGILFSKVSPILRSLRKVASRLLRWVQSSIMYRNIVRRLIRTEIRYQWEYNGIYESSLLAKKNGGVVGRSTVKNNSQCQGWVIFGMWVDWRYRRLGIGEHLIKEACDFAARHGAEDIKLWVFRDNQPAIKFYQKLGFHQASLPDLEQIVKQEDIRVGRARMIMSKSLT